MLIISIIGNLALLIVCPGYMDFIRDISNYNKMFVVAGFISILFHIYRVTIFSSGIDKQNQYRLITTLVLVLIFISILLVDRSLLWQAIQQILWCTMIYCDGSVFREKYNLIKKLD